MNKIDVRHSCIVINNYDIGDCPVLERKFTMFDQVRYCTYFKGIRYDPDTKQLFLPRSVNITWLEQLFGCIAYLNPYHSKFDYNPDILIKYLPRDDTQKTAFRFVLGVGEYEYTKSKSQLMLALNTGAGKTYIAISTLAYSLIKGVIIAGSIDWLNQWADRIVEYTDIKRSEIYMIQGTASINSILRKSDTSKYKVYLASHNTLKSYAESTSWSKVGELFEHLRIGYKIYDEAHLNFDNMCDIDFATNVYKTLYLTATPARSDEKENQIYQEYMRAIPAIDLFDEENDPRTQYIALKYNSRLKPMEQNKCVNKFGFNKMTYCNYVVHQENFEYILHIVIDMIKKVGGKTLIYVATNEAIKYLYNWIQSRYPEFIGNVGIFTTINTEYKEEAKDKAIILSTTKSCGAAIDIKGLKMTVQLAEPMKSKVLSRQSLGRTRDHNTYYLDVIDTGTSATRSYYLSRLPLFNKYATKCSEVSFKDDMLKQKAQELLDKRMGKTHAFIHLGDDGKPVAVNPFIHL